MKTARPKFPNPVLSRRRFLGHAALGAGLCMTFEISGPFPDRDVVLQSGFDPRATDV